MISQVSSRFLLLRTSCNLLINHGIGITASCHKTHFSLPIVTMRHRKQSTMSQDPCPGQDLFTNKIFPPGILFAFAYGSAAFPQHHAGEDESHQNMAKQSPGGQHSDKMLDVVLVVRDSLSWHESNLSMNPSHYCQLLRIAGADVIHWMQRMVKAFIYYNVVMDMSSISQTKSSSCTSLKYGVIEYEDLVRDLLTWDCLYVAGRMHKPIYVLFGGEDENITSDLFQASRRNRESAVAASFLLLMREDPLSVTLDDILTTIAGLSYTGDFRMIIGEDKSKVQKIVSSQKDLLKEIYMPIIREILKNESYDYDKESQQFNIHFSDRLVIKLIRLMPAKVEESFGGIEQWSMHLFGSKTKLMEERRVCMTIAHKQLMSFCLRKCITSIVRKSCISQSVKGFFSVGFVNAIDYVSRKMRKMLSSISS